MRTYIYTLSDPKTNEIKYVGKSINPYDRFRKHINEASQNKKRTHKNNWIRLLLSIGEKPKLDIIDETDGEWEWLEIYWICQLKAWGFKLVNGTEGGDNPPSWKNRTHNDITKEKIRKARSKPMLIPMNEKWKKNISDGLKKIKFNPSKAAEANKKPVTQYSINGELLKEFNSVTEATNYLGLNIASSIICVCNGKRFKAGGFRWAFKNNDLKNFKKQKNKIKKVIQYDMKNSKIKEWESISSVTKELGIDSSQITKVCRGKAKSSGGYKWKYK